MLVWTPLVLVLGLCALVYLPTLGAPFLFDDLEVIVNNESFLEGRGVAEYAEQHRFRQELMRSYKRDLWLSGGERPDPAIFHAANVLTHLAVVALFYWLVLTLGRRIGCDERGRLGLAFLSAAIFALHPMTTEPVAYVTGRADLLATWYSLLALTLFLIPLSYQPENEEGPDAAQAQVSTLPPRTYWKVTIGCWMLALASFLKGVFCKEVAVMAPVLVALVLAIIPGQTRPWRRRTFVALGVAFLVVVALLIVRLLAFGTLGNPDLQRPLFSTMASNVFATFQYFLMWLIPLNQSGDHDSLVFPGFGHVAVWIALLLLVTIAATAWTLRRRAPEVTLGVFWCFAALVPTNSVIAIEDVFVERRFYLSSMGLAVAAAGLALRASARLRQRRPEFWSRWKRRVLVGALGLLGVLSLMRVAVWSDRVFFWADAAKKARIKTRPYYNLGTALIEEGYPEQAIGAFSLLFERNAYDVDAHLNIGNALMEAGWVNQAQNVFKNNVLHLDPDNAEARFNLGVIAQKKGEYKDAEQYFKEALHLQPDMAEAAVQLGILNFSRDEPRVALQYFKNAVEQTPDDPLAHRYLALIYSQMLVDEEKALFHFEELARLEPRQPQNWFNLGVIQERMGRLQQARDSYRRTLDLEPTHVPALLNLGAIFDREGHRIEACRLYEKAAAIDPAQRRLVESRCRQQGRPLDSDR